MSTTCIEVRDSLADLASSWDALVAKQPIASPFLRSWWLEGVAGPRPRFVLVVDDGQLIGGVPLEEHRRMGMSQLQFIGSRNLAADHLDLVAAPGRETTVVDSLTGWFGRGGSRLFDLGGLVPSARVGKTLPGTVHVEPQAIAPWSPLPRTFDEYISGRPPALLSTLRNAASGSHGRARHTTPSTSRGSIKRCWTSGDSTAGAGGKSQRSCPNSIGSVLRRVSGSSAGR